VEDKPASLEEQVAESTADDPGDLSEEQAVREVFDRWLGDPRVKFYPEPRGLDSAFRRATSPFLNQQASKWIGDCYLLAYSREADAQLATFDRALAKVARESGCGVVVPS